MRLDQAEEGPATRADRLAATIAKRRKAAGDDSLEALSLDPFGALKYVCSHTNGVSRAVVTADILVGLEVVGDLRQALDRLELDLMRKGRMENLTWQQLADVLGMSSRQAAMQRYERLRLVTAGDHGTVIIARSAERSRGAEARWFAGNRGAIEEIARVLASTSFCSPAVQDDAESLAEALADPEATTGTLLAWISQILSGLKHTADVPPGLGAVLEDADRLVDQWRAVRPPVL